MNAAGNGRDDRGRKNRRANSPKVTHRSFSTKDVDASRFGRGAARFPDWKVEDCHGWPRMASGSGEPRFSTMS